MSSNIADRSLDGYWPSAWPGEDAGPRRTQAPRGTAGFALTEQSELTATTRSHFGGTMVVQRDPGELYLLSSTLRIGSGSEPTVSWLERIDPESLETVVRSPDLAGGPWWPGGVAAHANGSLYVTFGRWCHRLDAGCEPVCARELPRDRPYNSFVILADGHLVMKDFANDEGGPSQLVVLEPDRLEIVATADLPEGSIARLSADGGTVYTLGTDHAYRHRWDGERGELVADEGWTTRYRTDEGQTFGWDVVLDGASAWFLDDGDGTERFAGSFRGVGVSTAPLRFWRIPLDGGPATGLEICGEPGGVIANPPVVDPDRRVAVGYDSGNGVLAAWRYGEPGEAELLWRHEQHHAAHMVRFADTGELVTAHYDHDRTVEQCVVRHIETGVELGRVDTGSPVQGFLFPCVGWDRDVYVLTIGALTRVQAVG